MESNLILPTLPYLLTDAGVPFIHRDLSWIQFNERVLNEARAPSNPVLERGKFLSITASNLDEFFVVRFGSLEKQKPSRAHDRIRRRILESVAAFCARQEETLDVLTQELEPHGIQLIQSSNRDDPAYKEGRRIFEKEILPKLPAPEPYSLAQFRKLSNLQLAAVFDERTWISIPKDMPLAFLSLSTDEKSGTIFLLDDLLTTYLGPALSMAKAPAVFRITRDGDFTVDLEEEDPENVPDVVQKGVGTRDLGRPVRIQYTGEVTQEMLRKIPPFLRLSPSQLFFHQNTLCLRDLWNMIRKLPPHFLGNDKLGYKDVTPSIPHVLQDPSKIFAELKRQDILLHQPYDSFDSYVKFIQAACEDPDVTSIQQTVYRMDAYSPVVQLLKKAAKKKQVRVLIELRARFDEINNLRLAQDLRQAGATVAFGFGNLKLHAKLALVTRKEKTADKNEMHEVFYSHLSTGNYNATTARLYEDLSILTADPGIGRDVHKFFDSVTQGKVPSAFRKIVSAPTQLHKTLMNLIAVETEAARLGRPARVVAKVNALVDKDVINQLYIASKAGVKIDLIVRGACSLIPGVKGLSDNIKVISVVDRFLEHSRVYYFEHSKALYLSSADWMPRNFFSRLEIAFPVEDPAIRQYLTDVVLPAYLMDSIRATELTPQGTWKRRAIPNKKIRSEQVQKLLTRMNQKQLRAQFFFEQIAKWRYTDTPLERTGGKP